MAAAGMKGAWLRWHAGYESDGIASERVLRCARRIAGRSCDWKFIRRTTDIMAAASVANENFGGRFNAASESGSAGGACSAWMA